MSNIRKIAITLIIFFIGFLLVDIVVGRAFSYLRHHLPDDGERVAKSEFIINRVKSDVIIVGSSKAQCHYDCSIIHEYFPGLSVYNCGIDGQNYYYTTLSLLLMLERYSPKVIIWEIADFTPDDQEDLSLLYPYYNDNILINEVIDKREPSFKYFSWINSYKYNGVSARLIRSMFVKDPLTEGYKALQKHHLSKDIKVEQNHKAINSETEKLPEADSVKVDLFKNIINITSHRNIQLYIVRSPSLFESNDMILSQLCNTYSIPYFNFGDSIEFSNNLELWYDAVHLNSDGAALFTEMLMKQITDYKTGQQSVEHTSDIL